MAGFRRLLGAAVVTAAITDLSCGAASSSEGRHSGTGAGGGAPMVDCLGAVAPMTVKGGRPWLDVTFEDATSRRRGSFLLDFATTYSTVDPRWLSPSGPHVLMGIETGLPSARCDPTRIGERCSFSSFAFAGAGSEAALAIAEHADAQAGILGTDLTRRFAITLDYVHGAVRRAPKASFCREDDLRAAGLSALASGGFFTDDPARLRPLSDVIAGAAADMRVANVPTVPLRIGGVVAQAQLDTGFEDTLVPFSVNVNEALFTRLSAANPGALVRAADRDLTLSTCAGVSEPVEAYALGPGAAVDFVDEAGALVRSFPSATIFVKRTPAAARRCGGIGTWTAPGAQVAASFYAAFGLVVFDPFASRVWIRRCPASPSASRRSTTCSSSS